MSLGYKLGIAVLSGFVTIIVLDLLHLFTSDSNALLGLGAALVVFLSLKPGTEV